LASCTTTAATPDNAVLTCLTKTFADASVVLDDAVTMLANGMHGGGCMYRLDAEYTDLEGANAAGAYANSSMFRADMSRCLCTEFNSSDAICHESAHEHLPAHFDVSTVDVMVDSCTSGGVSTAAATTSTSSTVTVTNKTWSTFDMVLVASCGLLAMFLLLVMVVWSRRHDKSAVPPTPAAAPLQPQATTVSKLDEEPPPLLPQEFNDEDEEEDEHEPEDFDDIL
jgi:hypothetical protein